MKPANSVFSGSGTTVFETMSRLASEHRAVNLGQGFPDEEGPDSVKDMADRAIREHSNQYPPMMGIPELRQSVARHAKRFYDLELDWQSEVLVTSGATEALAATILALIEPGDEAVVFEPLYDSYLPMLLRAGARPRLVRLAPPDWRLPHDALAAAFSERTKLILFNSPMNPTGKVFSGDELGFIGDLLRRFDAYAICDEVYEHQVFDDRRHVPLITLPGMRERAVRIASAGKTFSMTGWKVGYAMAAPPLIQTIAKAHQFLVFTTPPNLQRAVAYGLDNERAWYTGLAAALQDKRDYLAGALAGLGFGVLPCDATYFMNADFRPLGFNGDDVDVCRVLTTEAGVTAVPVSALYAEAGVDHLIRFCFCKKAEVLEAAVTRLRGYFAAAGPAPGQAPPSTDRRT
jgi:aspartate/methionine/tyrosine aminotransferase